MSNSISLSSKNHSKKLSTGRDRDKNKSVASESGSSQCDTPPLMEKDSTSSQGKFAGISPDSVQCMAEQIGVEINAEAITNLAEDVSYKLRQTIATIGLHSEMMKKSRVDMWDVNTVLMLSDCSPVVGTTFAPYISFGEEKLCCQTESYINVPECAMVTQSYVYTTTPTLLVEWITDEKSLNNSSIISVALQHYYTKVARAILNLKKKAKEIAVEDLLTNTRIGPIFPNLFNLAVLVLNDDNLNALNVPAKKPLQSNVLDMVDALCSNPCSLDTNIQQQFQRLFPVMVSNILGNGSLAEKMVAILTKITRTWPSFIAIGKGILFDYLSQGTKERLTAPMIKCVKALGRQALVECLGDHLDHIDAVIHSTRPRKNTRHLRETILDASTCLLKAEDTTYVEDYVLTDYTLYEMLGDSIMPRRTIFPYTDKVRHEKSNIEKTAEEDTYLPLRPVTRKSKVKLVPYIYKKQKSIIPRDAVFDPTKFRSDLMNSCIHVKIKNCRTTELPLRLCRINLGRNQVSDFGSKRSRHDVVAASGLLNRFRYKLRKKDEAFPIFGALML